MVNKELELAQHFVSKTNRNIFITGKAGTGKTTFLRGLQQSLNKRMIVVAPTGIAAINARGVTIHSFFQLPFGPIVPNSKNTIQRKFNRQKIDIIKSLDLVIIDEISMVRADVLDGIDEVLRRYKDKDTVFGGVQLLFIGDLQQLSPIVKPNDWELLRQFYKNAFFFSSLAYQQASVIPIELKFIYRQKNQDFIKILNEIRNNNLSPISSEILNKQYNPDFKPNQDDGYITLTTHNNRADKINDEELDKLNTELKNYKATVTGNFSESNYPTSNKLSFKLGAQVMFVKNDPSPEKRFFNGKIGTIVSLESDNVSVKCDDEIIDVSYVNWDNVKYSINDETKEITEKVEGTFSQIPLRLAWAITIHKSQGLTFEKAIIDAESSFAHGQTYVALSRCKTLEGIVLKSKISSASIISDNTIKSFNKNIENNQPDQDLLIASQKQYQLDLINQLFDFYPLIYPIKKLIDSYYKNQSVLQGNIIEVLEKIKDDGIIPLIKVGNTFKKQLIQLSNDINIPEKNTQIQSRFTKAVSYFKNETEKNINTIFQTFSFSTDNKAIEKELIGSVDRFEDLLNIKTFLLNNLSSEFSVELYLQMRAKAVLNKTKKTKQQRDVVSSTKHQKLFEDLKLLRLSIANSENVGAYAIFTQQTLFEFCELLPKDKKQLKKVYGMGKVRVEKYGDEILEVINEYRSKNNLKSKIEISEVVKQPKGNSKKMSLEFFNKGLSFKEIAEQRGLAISTIESHLADCVKDDLIAIDKLISQEKIDKIVKITEQNEIESLSDIKAIVGDKFSYPELKMITNHLNKKE